MERLYSYVFHFNHINKLWYAIPRELYVDYWQDHTTKGILKSWDLDLLIEHISKGGAENQ